MAKNTNLGGVFTTDLDSQPVSNKYLSTENVVGIIFDTSVVGGLDAALGTTGDAVTNFANGNVVELNTSKDVAAAGITESVLSGVAKETLDTFFTLATGEQRIFVSFMDSTSDTEFEAIEKMQLAAGGILYQIALWTGKPIATKDGSNYTLGTGNILSKLESVAETLGGKVGVTNYEGNAPVNILLSAPIANDGAVSLDNLPDLSELDYPKVSVVLGQPATQKAHKIMFAVNHVTNTPSYAPLGCLGAALACLATAPANESIAHVKNFNLVSAMSEAELGFGNVADATGENPTAYAATASFTNIKTVSYKKRLEKLHQKGYIFLTNYDGIENGVFFSSDQTLSNGDYRSLTRCRVMHKSRRVVRRALLPRVNSNVEIDAKTGTLSASAITLLQNEVISALDANMVEPGTSVCQISGRTCTIDANQDVLNTDAINIQYMLVPLGISSAIFVTESFASKV